MFKESLLDKLNKKFIVDALKIVFSRDVRGIANKITLLTVLAHENNAGFKGALLFFFGFLIFGIAIIHDQFL